jgi:hypothetical protein
MDNLYLGPGNNGFPYVKKDGTTKDRTDSNGKASIERKRDEDLIIEENTIYEIDRDCFDRLKKQKKKR